MCAHRGKINILVHVLPCLKFPSILAFMNHLIRWSCISLWSIFWSSARDVPNGTRIFTEQ